MNGVSCGNGAERMSRPDTRRREQVGLARDGGAFTAGLRRAAPPFIMSA